jgi:hypothetical protein
LVLPIEFQGCGILLQSTSQVAQLDEGVSAVIPHIGLLHRITPMKDLQSFLIVPQSCLIIPGAEMNEPDLI